MSAVALANTEPISDTVAYDVAVPSFLVKGGDGYNMIKENLLEHRNTGFLDNDLLVSYIRKNTPLSVPKAGRIVVHTSGNDVVSGASVVHAGLGGILMSLVLNLAAVVLI